MKRGSVNAKRNTTIILGLLLALALLFVAAQLVDAAELPNAKLTPGDPNPVLTQKKICAPEFRTGPFRKVPASLKAKVYAAYGMKNHKGACAGKEGCELDHLESLEIGGSNSAKNLWPQQYVGTWGAHKKDVLENRLHKVVCAGQMTLKEAQVCISKNWIDCYKKVMMESK
jgi:hypothetical protein